MKKTIFVLPLCAFLAFCGSSRQVATPAGPGISNVNVSRNDTMTSAATAAASLTGTDRDWAYKASRDTSLNGTWALNGMMSADGSWSTTDTVASAGADTALSMTNTDLMNSTASTTSRTKSTAKGKTNRKALYQAAQSRLKMNFRDTTVRDTTVQPFQYWKRTPTLTINASNRVFSGNTGCNSMSGSFNFSEKDIQFGRNITTSKMMCNEYDESVFLSALKKADNYSLNGNVLELRQGNTLLLSFRKSS